MLEWYWKVIALKTAFVLLSLASYLRADDNVQKLPFCNPSNLRDGPGYNDLMIVSTLDGKLTAFSTQNGIKVWDIETQPLLSSNLHNLELTSGGKWVRLVPSLRGTLYSLSGDTIEPLPFDADQLLSSSYKYSDDLVIAGASETVWVGLDANTGAVMYECGSQGCSSEHAATGGARDVIVLRRRASTVRALDPRAGTEKWNFSVGEHQLALSRGECLGAGGGGGPARAVSVAVALHDGRVAVRTPGDYQLIWQQKLEAPVAGMWRMEGGALQSIDVVWQATHELAGAGQHPSLYIGVHNTQLYIQESPFYARKLETTLTASPVPWKLVTGRPMIDSNTAVSVVHDHSLAQVAQYGSKGLDGDFGFFLYLQETCDQSVQTTPEEIDAAETAERDNASDDAHEHHHIHVHVYSLWFWWKEVVIISVTSALLMNLLIWPRFFAPKPLPALDQPKESSGKLSRSDLVTHYERFPGAAQQAQRALAANTGAEYSRRYETDFTPLRCLGRGGFGVVFEVRNNIDHCCYALKRITLPRKEKKRERVRREVRALAKLDHVNIVRYFNAWEECPPPHAQQRDLALIRELEGVSALSDELYTSSPLSSPAKSPANKGDSVILNLHKHYDSEGLDYRPQEPKRNRFDQRVCIHRAGRRVRPPDGKRTNRSLPTVLDDVTLDVADKNIPSLSCSDSIVFDSEAPAGDSGTHDLDHGDHVTSGRNSSSIDKRLTRVQETDYKTDSSHCNKKKKGHTRHWSLDACVKNPEDVPGIEPAPLYLYIQMQLCRRDSLHDWLRASRTQDRCFNEIKSLFRQIVCAVDYVHAAGLIHRDLKPSNILFSPDGVVKVGDFGLVTSMGETSQDGERPEQVDAYQRHTYRVGTHLYMSPEQIHGLPYSYKVDIYSLGLILFELLQPFGTESERVRCLEDVKRGVYPEQFREKYPDEVQALGVMLSADPSRRPTALGVRARAPLCERTDGRYHFTLPTNLTVSV